VGFSIHQFSEVFKIRDTAGQPYVLIGGQAVNYWAERYLPAESELKPSYPPKVELTALSGVIPLQIGDLKSSIDVVRRVPGISEAREIPAVQAGVGRDGFAGKKGSVAQFVGF
jgi:hypothetical protein